MTMHARITRCAVVALLALLPLGGCAGGSSGGDPTMPPYGDMHGN